MLSSIILHPSALQASNKEDKSFFFAAVRLLLDLLDSGLLLVDEGGIIIDKIVSIIRDWPDEFSGIGYHLISELFKNQRIVSTSIIESLTNSCKAEECNNCLALISLNLHDSIIAEGQCYKCISDSGSASSSSTLKMTGVGSFLVSHSSIPKGFTVFNSYGSDEIDSGNQNDFTRLKFEETVLRPVFMYAESIKVIDKHIGRNAGLRKREKLFRSYKTNIEWLLDFCVNELGRNDLEFFEVCCGIKISKPCNELSKKDVENIRRGVDELRDFESSMQEIFSNFKLLIKLEDRLNDLPHDRYLITNQVGLFIGRGFELFADSNTLDNTTKELKSGIKVNKSDLLKNTEIGYCTHPYSIEKKLQIWPEIEEIIKIYS